MSESTAEPVLDRRRIVELAGDVIDEVGLDEFRLGLIADRAGVTQPALYRHVESVADLWRALGLDTRSRLAEVLIAAGVGRSGSDALRSVSHAWRGFAHRHPGRYRSTERYPVRGDAELEAAVERVVDVLALSLQGFGRDPVGTRQAAVVLRSALHGFVSFELGDGNVGPADETFDGLVDMLDAGFCPVGAR